MGRVLLVAGSRNLGGAVALAAEAALRSGVGFLEIACPGCLLDILTTRVPEAVLFHRGDSRRLHFIAGDADPVLDAAENADAVVVGPGLGPGSQPKEFVKRLLLEAADLELPWVFDADALNHLAALGQEVRLPARTVLTPHPGEAARLLRREGGPAAIQADRAGSHAALAQLTGATVVLKGAGTLVGGPEEPPWVCEAGNPGLATAGTGDVLAGLLGGFLARGLEPGPAARLAVHVHAAAGDRAAARLGEESLLARDLLEEIPGVLKEHPREEA